MPIKSQKTNEPDLSEERILEILRNHPLTRQIIRDAERKEASVEDRKKASLELKELEREMSEQLPLLIQAIEEKKKLFFEAEGWFKKARIDYLKAEGSYSAKRQIFEFEIDRCKEFLLKTAPVELLSEYYKIPERIEKVRKSSINEIFIDKGLNQDLQRKIKITNDIPIILEEIKSLENQREILLEKIYNPEEA